MLDTFLSKKPLYYDEIDYARMPRVYESIKKSIKLPKTIHIIGTNGKGTTGRFLASSIYSMGYSVGHYTSPHIMKFNERIWLNGLDVDNFVLNKAHNELLLLLSEEDAKSLSYFEYTTLLAMFIYQDMDYVVLEAGLGGEHDATSVFENILTLVTPIDIDHESFLGSSIKEIATTKLNAIQKASIISKQSYDEVYEVVRSIELKNNILIKNVDSFVNEKDRENIRLISKKNNLCKYLEENLSLSIGALKYLNIEYKVDDFNNSRLFGRLSSLNENIIVDVGHNVLAAKSIYNSLKFFKYTLVYNSYKDKEYKKILNILKPIVKDVEIIDIYGERVESKEAIQKVMRELNLEYKKFEKIDENKHYLVFGSFSVVEEFLKVYRG